MIFTCCAKFYLPDDCIWYIWIVINHDGGGGANFKFVDIYTGLLDYTNASRVFEKSNTRRKFKCAIIKLHAFFINKAKS